MISLNRRRFEASWRLSDGRASVYHGDESMRLFVPFLFSQVARRDARDFGERKDFFFFLFCSLFIVVFFTDWAESFFGFLYSGDDRRLERCEGARGCIF